MVESDNNNDTVSCINATTGSIDSNNGSNSNLSGNALSGGNSFMPSSIVGWLMLFALILLSVMLFRKLWVTEADKSTPLKHA